MDLTPILSAAGPFFRNIRHCQIEHFEKAVIGRKYRPALRDFTELPVESFDRIRGVNQSAHGFRILKVSRQLWPFF